MIWKWIKKFFNLKTADKTGKRHAWPTREEILKLDWFEELGRRDIVVVATPESARRAYDELALEKVTGFDTESKPTFTKGEISHGPHVAQFATLKRVYIFMLHEPECRRVAGALIGLAALKKVGFGLSDDVKKIREKLHVQPHDVFDLETMFRAKGYGRGVGVKVGVAIVLKRRFRKSKKISTSNWGAHYLSDPQLLYAANDAFAPLKVFHALAETKEKNK